MDYAVPRGRIGDFPNSPFVGARQRAPIPGNNNNANNNNNNNHENNSPSGRNSLPPAPENAAPAPSAPESQPLIPLTVIDAPSQRFYAFAVYLALFAWRLYDYLQVQDNGAHASYFFKWAAIDAVFLFSLPHFRIPWLELSSEFVLIAFFFAVVGDWWLMYNIPVPFQAWLLAFLKVFYDKEVAISEHNVKVSNILHNSSLIMGKHIINILPEGYVIS